MDPWAASDTNKVTGTQSNFGGSVRTTTSTTDDQYQMVTLTATGDNKSRLGSLTSNTPTVGEVVLTRSLTNVMDLGMVELKITVKGTYSLD
jgi:DNA-binding HxlR family transcriptional regulator